jgi:hypothetical protein
MQTAKKILIFETHDMGQLSVEKIQRVQSEPLDGASI